MDTLTDFQMGQGFLKRLENVTIEEMIPYQQKALYDEIDGAEKSHAIENFRLAAQMVKTGRCDSEFYGMVFQDSDVGKWLEAAAYALRIRPNAALEARVKEVVTLIESAQQEDGYLNTYFTVKEPGKRWTNLREAHELYCAGHLTEAAVALAECTGDKQLLRVMCRMADHMIGHFQGEYQKAFPGHPEVELALVRLYRCTGEERYLNLAKQFVDARGCSNYFQWELDRKPSTIWSKEVGDLEYSQSHLPVREQKDAVGHAVRAVYLYSAMADLAKETGDASLTDACKALWQSITQRRMYCTGGIGSTTIGEAFTKDYDLPNDTAYTETCAAIGLVFFARRMLELEKDGRYADTMERALYNGVASGVQLDGKSFFYVNPLEAIPGISGEAPTHRHALPQRAKWFMCACCPPNAARLFTSLGRYAWGVEENRVYSYLFAAGVLDLTASHGVKIKLETAYPVKDTLTYTIEAQPGRSIGLAVRLPQWSKKRSVTLNGNAASYEEKTGFAILQNLHDGDTVTVTLDLQPRRVYPSPKIADDSGKVALMRGPLVYCAEGVDNQEDVLGLSVSRTAPIQLLPEDTIAGVPMLRVKGTRTLDSGELYSLNPPQTAACEVTYIPYFAWANRGLTQMRCFIPERD